MHKNTVVVVYISHNAVPKELASMIHEKYTISTYDMISRLII